MYDAIYTLPPAIEIAQASAESPLIAEVSTAVFDPTKHVATVRINQAYETRAKIRAYKGPYITLIYDGHIVDVTACPVIRVPFGNIKRDFPNIFKDTVTLHIKGVSKSIADEIEAVKCLQIDTATVQRVVD